MSHPDPTKTYEDDIGDCICEETMDVACPFHGQTALNQERGYYKKPNMTQPQIYKTKDEAMEVFMAEHPECLDDDIPDAFNTWCQQNEIVIKELDEVRAEDLSASNGNY